MGTGNVRGAQHLGLETDAAEAGSTAPRLERTLGTGQPKRSRVSQDFLTPLVAVELGPASQDEPRRSVAATVGRLFSHSASPAFAPSVGTHQQVTAVSVNDDTEDTGFGRGGSAT
jgi:hypothetical protein